MRAALLAGALAMALSACTSQVPTAAAPDAPAAARATPSDLGAFFDCLREASATIVAAHRGGPAPGYPENALETFARTTDAIPALLEVDVALTRDGALVLMHDDTVDRTTTGQGRVRELTLAEIQALRLRDERGTITGARTPTLAQALDWAAGKAVLELDVKRGTPFERVVDAVRAAQAEERVVVIVYSLRDAIVVHRLAPRLMLSVSNDETRDVQALTDAGVDLSRVLAWTGIEEPNAALNVSLRARGIEVLFGTLGGSGSWDRRFAREGDEGYAAFAETGLQVIASDRPVDAHGAIDAGDGVDGWAGAACLR
ncbi:MAG: glycerophosphodiester phosphodiesterase [Alphaproteobacteria bacterium]|nr:glycerophosphodiester phosphodiesterase [Alphaproteobacteria bacterium]